MLKVILISIAIAVLGCIPLMGIPGVLVLIMSKPFVFLFYGPMAFEAFEQNLGSSSWPLVLILSILWPITIPLAFAVCEKFFTSLPFFAIQKFSLFCVLVVLGSSIISTVVISLNPELKRLSDSQVLEQALRKGNLKLVKKHWDSKRDEQFSLGDPLFIAIENKQDKLVKYLLNNGVSPLAYEVDPPYNEPGTTPLHSATQNGMTGIMEMLLKMGIDPNIRTTKGKVPLHDLGQLDRGALEVIELLKRYEADFTATDVYGNTALISMAMIHAPLEHRPLLAQKLIENGCPKNHKNTDGDTALDIVLRQQPYEVEFIEVLSLDAK